MTDGHTPLPARSSREETARREVGQTAVATPVARSLLWFFLAAIVAVPAFETIAPRIGAAAPGGATVWSKLSAAPATVIAVVKAESAERDATLWRRVVAGNRALLAGFSGFETALEDESALGRVLRPPAQQVLSRWLGAATERVYIGRDRWLFYRPDLEYLTSKGFLEEDVIRRRVATASEWEALPQPDPRPAILEFHRQLRAQGITLVIVPTPVKPGVHPEMLVANSPAGQQIVQNASYIQFTDWLRGQGILLFDPGDVLRGARQSGPQYLPTDTHWRPEAMELVAQRLAAFVAQHVALPAVAPLGHRIDEQEITNTGDTAAMLDLPGGQQRYPPDRALISRVIAPDGSAWRSDRAADVLVLGDSFSNIYSLESMGWGNAAGLVEHVSYTMNRPVDRIVQNDDGAFATREILQRAGPERLAGKRVVIWQFAARELAVGNWKVSQ
jgi:alginate O-acetyltransferase complex protein AlgJ